MWHRQKRESQPGSSGLWAAIAATPGLFPAIEDRRFNNFVFPLASANEADRLAQHFRQVGLTSCRTFTNRAGNACVSLSPTDYCTALLSTGSNTTLVQALHASPLLRTTYLTLMQQASGHQRQQMSELWDFYQLKHTDTAARAGQPLTAQAVGRVPRPARQPVAAAAAATTTRVDNPKANWVTVLNSLALCREEFDRMSPAQKNQRGFHQMQLNADAWIDVGVSQRAPHPFYIHLYHKDSASGAVKQVAAIGISGKLGQEKIWLNGREASRADAEAIHDCLANTLKMPGRLIEQVNHPDLVKDKSAAATLRLRLLTLYRQFEPIAQRYNPYEYQHTDGSVLRVKIDSANPQHAPLSIEYRAPDSGRRVFSISKTGQSVRYNGRPLDFSNEAACQGVLDSLMANCPSEFITDLSAKMRLQTVRSVNRLLTVLRGQCLQASNGRHAFACGDMTVTAYIGGSHTRPLRMEFGKTGQDTISIDLVGDEVQVNGTTLTDANFAQHAHLLAPLRDRTVIAALCDNFQPSQPQQRTGMGAGGAAGW